jgi:hypothetical protein
VAKERHAHHIRYRTHSTHTPPLAIPHSQRHSLNTLTHVLTCGTALTQTRSLHHLPTTPAFGHAPHTAPTHCIYTSRPFPTLATPKILRTRHSRRPFQPTIVVHAGVGDCVSSMARVPASTLSELNTLLAKAAADQHDAAMTVTKDTSVVRVRMEGPFQSMESFGVVNREIASLLIHQRSLAVNMTVLDTSPTHEVKGWREFTRRSGCVPPAGAHQTYLLSFSRMPPSPATRACQRWAFVLPTSITARACSTRLQLT